MNDDRSQSAVNSDIYQSYVKALADSSHYAATVNSTGAGAKGRATSGPHAGSSAVLRSDGLSTTTGRDDQSHIRANATPSLSRSPNLLQVPRRNALSVKPRQQQRPGQQFQPEIGTEAQGANTSTWTWDDPTGNIANHSGLYTFAPSDGRSAGEHSDAQRVDSIAQPDGNLPNGAQRIESAWSTSSREPATTTIEKDFQLPQTRTAALSHDGKDNPTKRKFLLDELIPDPAPDPKRVGRTKSAPSSNLQVPAVQAESSGSKARSQASTDATIDVLAMAPQDSSSSSPNAPLALPARKVFSIQVGNKIFRLSGASLQSDAPSYFTRFFEQQIRQGTDVAQVGTLYIDRDPTTFQDIVLHLQGYSVHPRSGRDFTRLFSDAQFYNLPRLAAQLSTTPMYIRVGDTDFEVPHRLFEGPGDSPNYFSSFAALFTSTVERSPGFLQQAATRSPPAMPASVPNRCARIFAEILHILQGYPIEIRDREHRQALLRDVRYYALQGLEQRIIPHSLTYNLSRKKSEITLRLEDIRRAGLSYIPDTVSTSNASSPASSITSNGPVRPGWIHYQRPYIDNEFYTLIVEIDGDENTVLHIGAIDQLDHDGRPTIEAQAIFHNDVQSRLTRLLATAANKMNLPSIQPLGKLLTERGQGISSLPASPKNSGVSMDSVKVCIGPDADITVDGKRWSLAKRASFTEDEPGFQQWNPNDAGVQTPMAQRDTFHRHSSTTPAGAFQDEEEWVLTKAQWRLRVQYVPATPGANLPQSPKPNMEIALHAVKLVALRSERGRNEARSFLT